MEEQNKAVTLLLCKCLQSTKTGIDHIWRRQYYFHLLDAGCNIKGPKGGLYNLVFMFCV